MTTRTKNRVPASGVTGFGMEVMPAKEYLDKAIADNGFCRPEKCWHKVAVNAIVIAWGEGNARVKVDAGHIKLNYRGWRYIADTPRHVKRGLMLFDKKLYDQVRIREYSLRFRRTTKIVAISPERQQEIEAARRARIKAGGTEHKRRYPNMRKRVEGFSSIV
mgnify:CR=1 FL=1